MGGWIPRGVVNTGLRSTRGCGLQVFGCDRRIRGGQFLSARACRGVQVIIFFLMCGMKPQHSNCKKCEAKKPLACDSYSSKLTDMPTEWIIRRRDGSHPDALKQREEENQ